MSHSKQNRREFLEKVTLGVAGAGAAVSGNALTALPAAAAKGEMPYRTLGRSGEKVSLLGLGGYHIGIQNDEQESIRIVRTAIDNGVNFMDNCWDYNGGTSEIRMGKALRDGYRKKVFLMTKIDGQVKDARRAADRRIAPALANRHHRSAAISRSHSPRRPRPHLRPRRQPRSRDGRQESRQDSLHRLYRPQGPRHPSEDAQYRHSSTASRLTPCRCRST